MLLKGKASLPLPPLGEPKPVGEQLVHRGWAELHVTREGWMGPCWPLSLLYFTPVEFEMAFQK